MPRGEVIEHCARDLHFLAYDVCYFSFTACGKDETGRAVDTHPDQWQCNDAGMQECQGNQGFTPSLCSSTYDFNTERMLWGAN
eukprot:scaffold10069_cov17-Tisochrysis_lutea.AAC.2